MRRSAAPLRAEGGVPGLPRGPAGAALGQRAGARRWSTPAQRFATGFARCRSTARHWRVFAAHGAERDVQVYVGEQMDSRAAILWAVLRSMLWPMLLALPLLALAAWWAVRRGMAPLRRLGRTLAGRAAAGAAAGRARRRAVRDGADARRAERPVRAHRRADGVRAPLHRRRRARAAHADRAIRAQAQVALGEADDALRRHALQATLEGCDRATRLVEQLLTLSRLEAGAAPRARAGRPGRAGAPRGGRTGAAGAGKRQSDRARRADSRARCAATRRCWRCWCATWSTTRSATARRGAACRSR